MAMLSAASAMRATSPVVVATRNSASSSRRPAVHPGARSRAASVVTRATPMPGLPVTGLKDLSCCVEVGDGWMGEKGKNKKFSRFVVVFY